MKASFLLACDLVLASALLPAISHAQEHPPASRDTTARDSNAVSPNHGAVAVALAAATLVMLAAPGPLVFVTNPDTTHLGFADNHVAVSVTAGPLFGLGRGQDFGGWAYSAGVETLMNGVYAELRTENFTLDHVRFWTIRGGYLFHPKAAVAGGATLGYRYAGRAGLENAIEVGFPLVVGTRRGWMRFEPSYVISSQGVSWNYRWQSEFPVSHGLHGGFDFDVKPIHQAVSYTHLTLPTICSV